MLWDVEFPAVWPEDWIITPGWNIHSKPFIQSLCSYLSSGETAHYVSIVLCQLFSHLPSNRLKDGWEFRYGNASGLKPSSLFPLPGRTWPSSVPYFFITLLYYLAPYFGPTGEEEEDGDGDDDDDNLR